jgi:hypothetical protein
LPHLSLRIRARENTLSRGPLLQEGHGRYAAEYEVISEQIGTKFSTLPVYSKPA